MTTLVLAADQAAHRARAGIHTIVRHMLGHQRRYLGSDMARAADLAQERLGRGNPGMRVPRAADAPVRGDQRVCGFAKVVAERGQQQH